VGRRDVEGVLIAGVYGSGKSSVAAEIGYMLERAHQPYALLDLDYLSWAGTGGGRAEEFGLLLQNLADVAGNYRRAGIGLFVFAYFLRDGAELQALRKAAGMPLRVARLEIPLADIEQRLATEIISGRRDDLRQAASSIAASEGVGLEDVTITNDCAIAVVAGELMTFLEWL
jgi:hypothetical protein